MTDNQHDGNYEAALDAANKLEGLSEDSLYAELGLRIQDMMSIGGYKRSQYYEADFSQETVRNLSWDDIVEFGKRWWAKLEPELMEIICNPNSEEQKKITDGKTIPQVAAALATAAVISAFAPPAWIIVATSILAAKIVETGLETLCEQWNESLKKNQTTITPS